MSALEVVAVSAREVVAVSAREVSVATGPSGPLLVLAGEADVTSAVQFGEALNAQVTGQAVRLTVDASGLRYADSASMRTLLKAAAKITSRDGTVTLLNPQPPVARLLDLLCVNGMISVERRNPNETQPDASGDGD